MIGQHNYPVANIMADLFSVIKEIGNETDCPNLKAVVNTPYCKRDMNRYTIGISGQKCYGVIVPLDNWQKIRNRIVYEVREGLKGHSRFDMSFHQFLGLQSLGQWYDVMQKTDSETIAVTLWDKIKSDIEKVSPDFYNSTAIPINL